MLTCAICNLILKSFDSKDKNLSLSKPHLFSNKFQHKLKALYIVAHLN